MPNLFAYFMLAVWPLVVLVLFARLEPARAFVVTIVAGYLLLPPAPANFDFPLLPPLGKSNIPALSAIAALLLSRRWPDRLLPRSGVVRLLLAIFVFSPYLTFLGNREPVFFGAIGLPGMRLFEAFALSLQHALVAVSFLLARALLGRAGAGSRTDGGAAGRNDGGAGLRLVVLALFIGGLAYSLPMLVEVRLSPQINKIVYGYYQHIFAQSIRGGGFRPLVFLNHGLWAAFFAMMATTAALALWRSERGENRMFYLLASGYLGLVLVLCKTLGALLLGLGLLALIACLRPLWQLRVAVLVGALAVSYPLLRTADLVPGEFLVAQAAKLSPERANSLRFRFDNEEVLFARAQAKPAFGWGIWGRNQILDPRTGAYETVTDGRWIITFGRYGWLGYIGEFGLLFWPLVLLWRGAGGRSGARLPWLAGPVALMLAANLVDLIPNATLTPLTWLLAGALLGAAERGRISDDTPPPETPPPETPPPGTEPLRTVL